jgi:hypothetical protein
VGECGLGNDGVGGRRCLGEGGRTGNNSSSAGRELSGCMGMGGRGIRRGGGERKRGLSMAAQTFAGRVAFLVQPGIYLGGSARS